MVLSTKDISGLFHTRDQVHVWHLQTKGYEVHKTLGEFYKAWESFLDEVIETDAAGQVPLAPNSMGPTIEPYADGSAEVFLKEAVRPWLMTVYTRATTEPGIQNLVADAINLVDHTLYKLSLK